MFWLVDLSGLGHTVSKAKFRRLFNNSCYLLDSSVVYVAAEVGGQWPASIHVARTGPGWYPTNQEHGNRKRPGFLLGSLSSFVDFRQCWIFLLDLLYPLVIVVSKKASNPVGNSRHKSIWRWFLFTITIFSMFISERPLVIKTPELVLLLFYIVWGANTFASLRQCYNTSFLAGVVFWVRIQVLVSVGAFLCTLWFKRS